MMVVILLGVPLAVLEVRSVAASTKTVLHIEAQMLAETVSMQVSKASRNGANTIPLREYEPNFREMIARDHSALISVDGQIPVPVPQDDPLAGQPVFIGTYSVDDVLNNVGVHVIVRA